MTTTNTHTWLITGAARGIGLELTKQLLAKTSDVVLAAARTPAKANALNALKDAAGARLHVITLDVADQQSIADSVREVTAALDGRGIDYLINNAGICPDPRGATDFDIDAMLEAIRVNVGGPALVTRTYHPFVQRGDRKMIVNVSSSMGSLAYASSLNDTRSTGYTISKAALNMLTVKQKIAYPDVTVVSLCPGWLKTDLGSSYAPLEVADGVAGVLKVVTGLKASDSGSFINYEGKAVQW